tara:strand:+ start:1138 stop:2943 length:1806 start_codon:yes stop_codon:yes gene_type:complete
MSFSSCSCEREVFVRQSGALISVNPMALDFGDVPMGLSSTRTIEVLNLGQMPLKISDWVLVDEESVFSVELGVDQVGVSSSETISVTFSPTAIKEYQGTLTLNTDAENTKLTLIPLSGQGLPDSICGDCDEPPEDRCMSEYDLLVYDNVGACVEGECQYQASQIYCEFGCDPDTHRCKGDSGPIEESDAGGQTPLLPSDAGNGDSLWEPDESDAGVYIPEGDYVQEVQVGSQWTCVRWSTSDVECFGINKWGQLGLGWWDGMSEDSINPTPQPALIPSDRAVVAIETGNTSTTVTTESGDLYCWGGCPHRRPSNTQGQNKHTPEVVTGITSTRAAKTGWGHSCVIRDDGDLECWGSNWFGGLGTGDDLFPSNGGPVVVDGVSNVVKLAVGYHHTCALQDDGKLFCWGWNHRYQVATPMDDNEVCPNSDSYPCVLSPREIQGLDSDFIDVAAGVNNTCVITAADGKVYCWGDNQSGAIGNGVHQPFAREGEPIETEDLGQRAVKLSLGSTYALAIMADGSVKGWGQNSYGQLGNGSMTSPQNSPLAVVGLEGPVIQISAGVNHSCALLENRSVWCWGRNNYGQLGDGTSVDSASPVQVVFPE